MFWTQSFWPYIGGVEMFAMRLLSALQERGHELLVVASHGSLDLPDEDRFESIPIHRLPFQHALADGDARRVIAAQKRLTGIKQTFKPELLHINLQDPSVFFHLQTARSWPCPTLLTIHGELGDCSAGDGTLLGKALRDADHVNTVSQALLDDVHVLVPEVRAHSSLVYNAIPAFPKAFTPTPGESRRIACIGRQVPEKGFDLAIAAFARIITEFPDARLAFASDGPENRRLREQAADLGVAHAVDFLGWLNPRELSDLMASSLMVMMPSRWREGFGLVALEAAMHGRAVIATRVGGLPEVVANDETGILVDREDVDALAQAALRLLRNPGLAVKLGAAGRTRANRRFDFDFHTDQYEALYRQLAAQHREATAIAAPPAGLPRTATKSQEQS